jgi:hypothetical protein
MPRRTGSGWVIEDAAGERQHGRDSDPVRDLMRQHYRGNPRGERQSSMLRSALHELTRVVGRVDAAQVASPSGDALVKRTLHLLRAAHGDLAEALAAPPGADEPAVPPPGPLPPGPGPLARTFIDSLKDPEWEPGLRDYVSDLLQINAIVVRATGGPAEGSLFYPWGVEPYDRPHPEFLDRRRNFALLAAISTRMVEVGVNAGHSCLLAMHVNPALHYTGIDWAGHAYSHQCLDKLEALFARRVSLLREDSRQALAKLCETASGSFDFVHLDGGHDFDFMMSDLGAALRLTRPGGLILVDDDDMFPVYAACDYAVLAGWAEPVDLGALWTPARQRLLRAKR